MPSAVTQHDLIDDVRARRNTILLAAAQAFYGVSAMVVVATGGLVGYSLADNKGFATVPITCFVAGAAVFTIPASMFMRRVGRRIGFMSGAGLGALSGAIAVYAIFIQSFELFALGTFFGGAYQAFSQYYRFAAADVASEQFKAKAISWVLIGGIVSAVFGPFLIVGTTDYFAPVLFAGAFVSSMACALIAMAILAFIDIPKPPPASASSDARPLRQIIRQPRLVIAIVCGMTSYGMMSLVMTASPLAMVACGFTANDATWVIQWHVLAMFVPSLFTGHLINRFGKERVIAAGMALLAACGIVALAGISFANFGIALVFLGLGWNFGFVGATALVTDCYRRSERNKVQALNDFCVFGMVALSSFASGKLLNLLGWDAVNITLFPMIAVTVALLAWLVLHERRTARFAA